MADPVPDTTLVQIQPPTNFDFTRPELWPLWEKRFLRYLNVTGLVAKTDVIKIDILCYSMGEKSEEILVQIMPNCLLQFEITSSGGGGERRSVYNGAAYQGRVMRLWEFEGSAIPRPHRDWVNRYTNVGEAAIDLGSNLR